MCLVSPDDDPDRIVRPGRADTAIPRARGFRTSRRSTEALLAVVEKFRPDVAIVHNTAGFLTASVIRALARTVPTAKHIHDARVICPRTLSKILPEPAPDGLPQVCEHRAGSACLATGCLAADRRGPNDVGPLSEQARETWIRLRSLAAIRHLPAIFVDSRYMADEAHRNGIPAERTHVLGQISLQEPSGPALPADRPRITAVGRWDEAKGFAPFLEVLLDLARANSFDANLVGDGPGIDAGRSQVRAAGLENRIHIRGKLDHRAMETIYRETDVVAMPTCVPESFGIVGLEAHAHGLPVVAFGIGGVNDWLIDGETGISIPLGDWEAFGAAIEQLCVDPDKRKTLGASGRQRRTEKYGTEAHLDRLLSLLSNLVAS